MARSARHILGFSVLPGDSLRYLTRAERWSDRAAKISFWSLNIGLAWMAFVNLFPLGIVQLYYAVDTGYWYARSLDFLNLPWVNVLEWARLPGDALFIVGGALPLVWLCWQALRYPNPRRIDAESELPVCSSLTSPIPSNGDAQTAAIGLVD